MPVSLQCDGCGLVFSLDDALDIEIIGPDYERDDYEWYACPDCGYVVRVPIEDTEDEP
jgi:rubredoxin